MQLDVWTIQGRVFHFGREQGLGMEGSAVTWPSDSLFAALVAQLALHEGDAAVQQAVAAFLRRDPPFLLTSTYPCVCPKAKAPVLLFPVPMAARRPAGPLPAGVTTKDLKRVRFVSEGLYQALLSGHTLADLYPQARRAGHGTLLFDPTDWARLPKPWRDEGEELTLWAVSKRARVTVGRLSNRSNLFYVGTVTFRPGAGLWFGVHWRRSDAFWAARLPRLLTALGEAGLGAERNVGYGQARLQRLARGLTLPDAQPAAAWTTLSRYWPQPDEVDALRADGAAYALVRVGGWVDRVGQRRRPIYMVEEGAVLGGLTRPGPYGGLADVRPSYPADPDPLGHPVYRYGYALAVGYTSGAGAPTRATAATATDRHAGGQP